MICTIRSLESDGPIENKHKLVNEVSRGAVNARFSFEFVSKPTWLRVLTMATMKNCITPVVPGGIGQRKDGRSPSVIQTNTNATTDSKQVSIIENTTAPKREKSIGSISIIKKQ
jgi:hypothetical protein